MSPTGPVGLATSRDTVAPLDSHNLPTRLKRDLGMPLPDEATS